MAATAVVAVVALVGAVPGTAGAGSLPVQSKTPTSGPAPKFAFSAEPYSAPGTAQRSDFSYGLLPGHSVVDQFVVTNSSSGTQTFEVYPEDATNIPGSGGYGFQQQANIHNTQVGKWITVGNKTFSVPPGKAVVDTFQLSVPNSAAPGDHVGAVVVQQVPSKAQRQSGTGVNIVLRIAVPVFVRVVGPIHASLTISNVTVFHATPLIPGIGNSKVAVRFTVVNSGNAILDPKSASVTITGFIGGTIHSYTVHQTKGTQTSSAKHPLPAQMLPGGKLTLTELWNGLPPFDPMTAHVTVHDVQPIGGIPTSASATASFLYFPWLVVVIVVLLIVAFIWWRRRRRQKRIKAARGRHSRTTPDAARPTRGGAASPVAPPPAPPEPSTAPRAPL
ncbi:MAG: hypothetical protein ACYDHU_11440 [Acidimicrobiales bacterium]